jgi:hypothetical protein
MDLSYARVMFFSVYLAFEIPFCLIGMILIYHFSKKNNELKARMPRLSIVIMIASFLPGTSVALGRIFHDYPCSLLVWQDFLMCYVVAMLFAIKAWVLYFKFEWVNERLGFYKNMNHSVESVDKPDVSPIGGEQGQWFHQHRKWISNQMLLKITCATIGTFAIVPLGYSIHFRSTWRIGIDDPCGGSGWNQFIMLAVLFILVLAILCIRKIRRSFDAYGIRAELKVSGYIGLFMLIWFAIATFTHSFGRPEFPLGSAATAITNLLIAGVESWYPLFNILIWKKRKEGKIMSRMSQHGKHSRQKSREIKSSSQAGIVKLEYTDYKLFTRYMALFAHIDNPVGMAAFQKYLLSEFAVENLCFVLDAMKFHKDSVEYILEHGVETEDAESRAREKIMHHLAKIYETYLSPASVLQVNVSHEATREFAQEVQTFIAFSKNPSMKFQLEIPVNQLPHVLHSCIIEILNVIMEDSFRRYRMTEEYIQTHSVKGILTPMEKIANVSVNPVAVGGDKIQIELQQQFQSM